MQRRKRKGVIHVTALDVGLITMKSHSFYGVWFPVEAGESIRTRRMEAGGTLLFSVFHNLFLTDGYILRFTFFYT